MTSRSHLLRCSPALALLAAALGAKSTFAQTPKEAPSSDAEAFAMDARATTYVHFFQRALAPGPAGAPAQTETLAPAYEYVSLRARGLDGPLSAGTLEVELSGWGGYDAFDPGPERRLVGDLSAANVRQRIGPGYVRLGRQTFVGGAARFATFDGASGGVLDPSGIGADAYAGLTVLPPWDRRPGYQQLGSAADTLLKTPDALPPPKRAGTWLLGARAHYEKRTLGQVGLSFHEQRESSELGRRDLGFDLLVLPAEPVALSAEGILDVDSRRLADGRVFIDSQPGRTTSLSLSCSRTDPALFLSRQSILSVFHTDPFTETGGEVSYRPISRLVLRGAGFVQWFASDGVGARAEARARLTLSGVTAELVLGRVSEPGDGYYTQRASLGWPLSLATLVTLEHATYLYDHAIRTTSTSMVEAASLSWRVSPLLQLLLGGTLVRSPYASVDTQTLLRAEIDIDAPQRGGPR
jgi:hypothetical protein